MDDFESWFDKGVTDGLPVVPPTRERVERMLAGTRRDRGELAGKMPPNYGRATVERLAVNAVMAGCRPSICPWSWRRWKHPAIPPSRYTACPPPPTSRRPSS